MNVYDKILIFTFLFAIIVWQVLHQAHLFKQNKTISHFWKSIIYASAVLLITWPYISVYNWWYGLKIPSIAILERMAFFDFALNLVRSKPIFYNGDKSTGSLIDRLENKMEEDFIPAWKVSWVVIFILYLIYIK